MSLGTLIKDFEKKSYEMLAKTIIAIFSGSYHNFCLIKTFYLFKSSLRNLDALELYNSNPKTRLQADKLSQNRDLDYQSKTKLLFQ